MRARCCNGFIAPAFAVGRVIVSLVVALLCGCAGAPSVSDVYDSASESCDTKANPGCHYKKQEGKGVFYYLPRTELELQLDVKTEVVTPGRLTEHVKRCKQNPNADRLCAEEAEFKFKVAAAGSSDELCKSTNALGAVTSTTYYSLGDKTAITPVAVPDPTHLYFMEVTPSWWQTITASVQFSDTGLPSEMTAGGGNAAGKALASAATSLIGGVLLSLKSAPAEFLSIEDVIRDSGIKFAPATAPDEKERRAIIKKLREIAKRREDLILRNAVTGNPAAVLAALDAREKELKAIYEGAVKSDSILMVRRETLRDKAGGPLGTDIHWNDGKIVAMDPAVEVDGCSDHGADPKKIPLPMRIAFDAEPNSLEIANGQCAAQPEPDADQMGFRYRVPIPFMVTLHKNAQTLDRKSRLLDKEFPIELAQLGPTLVLPRKAGVFGGTVGASFVANTGRLKLFKTDATAEAAEAIVTQIQTEATKDRKIEALEKEEHELDLKAKIKEHNDTLSGTPAPAE